MSSKDLLTRNNLFYFFILPAVILLLFLSVYPSAQVVLLSIQNVNILKPSRAIIFTAANFVRMIVDPRFHHALQISFLFPCISTILTLFASLGLGLFLHSYTKGKMLGLLSTVFIIPAIVSRVAISYIWKLIYEPTIGILNYFLSFLGVGPVSLLSDPATALPSIMVVDLWQWGPIFSLVFLAALQMLPSEVLEAAKVDGASKWERFRYMTFPLLLPTTLVVILFKFVESLRIFDLIYILTRGGPGIATENVDMYAYWVGLSIGGDISYAASMSLVILVVTVLVATIVIKAYQRVYYET